MSPLLHRAGLKGTVVSPIGLDVGPRNIRAAQLERSGHFWRVLRTACWSKREDEIGTHASDGFTRRIGRMLQQGEFHGRRVIAGLSVPELEVHSLEIPDRGNSEPGGTFDQAVRWELQRVMSIAEDSAATSYWRLPASAGTRNTAIGVAAQASEVDAVSELAESLGLDCERVDATACALSRLGSVLRGRPDVDQQAVWGVLDVGYRMLRLVVCVGESPALVRILGHGGQAWTESVAGALGLSAEAAEVHKRDYGIDSPRAPTGEADSPEPSTEIATMIRSILNADLEAAVGEIERSYEYVMRCYLDRGAGELLLVGGGADMKGLNGYLTEKLGVEVQRIDDIIQTPGAPVSASPSIRESLGPYACAIGLAIEPEASL